MCLKRDVLNARISALCYLSTRGFEDWRFEPGTFNSDSFAMATRQMLLTPDANGRCLIEDFKVLLLDNAPIHHAAVDVLDELEQYVKVLFIPPYCYHLSPLDNGAFGWTVNFLKASENKHFGQRPIQEGLTAAFLAMPATAARYCFHNCNYLFRPDNDSDSDSSDSDSSDSDSDDA